jgi:hypothetical protein
MQRIVKVNCSIRQVMVLAVSMMLQVPTEAEAAGKELGFGCVVAGAVLRPEATEIGAGSEDFAFVVADEHGAGSGASTSKFA